ncbi:hypothetical protein BDV11DRAFT_183467, partial [Aspergillus similis]
MHQRSHSRGRCRRPRRVEFTERTWSSNECRPPYPHPHTHTHSHAHRQTHSHGHPQKHPHSTTHACPPPYSHDCYTCFKSSTRECDCEDYDLDRCGDGCQLQSRCQLQDDVHARCMSGAANVNMTATAAAMAGPGGGAYAHAAAHGDRDPHGHGHGHAQESQDRRYERHNHVRVEGCGGRCIRIHSSCDRGGEYCPGGHCEHGHKQEQEIHCCVSVGPAGMRHGGRGCGGDCEGEMGESWHREGYAYGPPLPPSLLDVGRGRCF